MATTKDPKTSAGSSVAGDSDEGLVLVLEKTIHAQVIRELQDPLSTIVQNAVRNAIVTASKTETDQPERPQHRQPGSRPSSGGKCAQVWDTLDKQTAAAGETPSLKDVQKLAKRKRWNPNTARIQYYRWRSASQQASA